MGGLYAEEIRKYNLGSRNWRRSKRPHLPRKMKPQEITEQPETPAECLEVTPLEGMIQTALAQYEVSEASIAELAEAYKDLKINGLEDKEGYDKCHAARMHVKGLRVGVDKTRIGLKSGAIVYGKAMDGRARDLKDLLVPIEQHLADEEAEFEAEREKARQERAKAKQALLTERMKQLDAVDARISRVIVDVMSEKAFKVALEQATKDFEVAQAEEAERKKAEALPAATKVDSKAPVIADLKTVKDAEADAFEQDGFAEDLKKLRAFREAVGAIGVPNAFSNQVYRVSILNLMEDLESELDDMIEACAARAGVEA